MVRFSSALPPLLVTGTLAGALNITDIQGPAFQSPYAGQAVSVNGIVTAKGDDGFFISGPPVDDVRVSNGIFVYSTSSSVLSSVSVGDMIMLNADVYEYRSSSRPNDLFLTELSRPANITVLSKDNTVNPVVLGQDRSPPTQFLSALDQGPDSFLSFPNNASQIEVVNATLEPAQYGMDFWESLEGQLVKIPSPVSQGFPNRYGEFWVHGDWKLTGENSRGGLTMTFGPDGIPDANPEAIMIGSPLDGSKNPETALGTTFGDIVGVVKYQYSFYYVLPLTAPTVTSSPDPEVPASKISKFWPWHLTVADYNVENMAPNSEHMDAIAQHISDKLRSPDLLFLQEIQDDSGTTDDGVVSANQTLTNLVNAIRSHNGVAYEWVNIDPLDKQDGGVPGGNIRQAYLYNPKKLTLASGVVAGSATDKLEVVSTKKGWWSPRRPSFSFNPGRIDPTHEAWEDSRKALAAEWITNTGATLFTINLHLASKGGSSSLEGDARPPVNSPSAQRISQVQVVTDFIKSILSISNNANIIVGGDMNEYPQTRGILGPLTSVVTPIDDAGHVPAVERYTYIYDQHSEQLDHLYISDSIRRSLGVKVEHIHVNTWSKNYDSRISDHDPTVARVTVY